MHADYGSPFKKKYVKLARPKVKVTWPDLPRRQTSTLASIQERSVGCFHVVPNSGLAPKAFHQIAIREHLYLHCPSIRVRVSVWDPDRIVFTLHSRLGSEVIWVHGHFGPYLVTTTWTGGFEHARFITSHFSWPDIIFWSQTTCPRCYPWSRSYPWPSYHQVYWRYCEQFRN